MRLGWSSWFRSASGGGHAAGDPVVDVIDPLAARTSTVRAEVAGVLYAHVSQRYALAGDELAKIAGPVPFRTGRLLSH